MRAILATLMLCLFVVSALAHDFAAAHRQPGAAALLAPGLVRMLQSAERHARLGRRPAAWCGWEMRRLVARDPGPSYNLARNWAHWGHPGPAGIGAVVVWRHHVGKIVGRRGDQWIVLSGNDGHRVRARPRSLAGAIAIRWM